MSIHQKIEDHPKAVTCAALCVILIVVAFFASPYLFRRTPPPPPTAAYFYDMTTGETFTAPVGSVPPIDHPQPSGVIDKAVRAYIFSCVDCADESSRFVGYLLSIDDDNRRRYLETPLGKQGKFPAPPPLGLQGMLPGLVPTATLNAAKSPTTAPKTAAAPASADALNPFLIAAPPATADGKPRWIPLAGKEGAALIKALTKRCGQMPHACEPREKL